MTEKLILITPLHGNTPCFLIFPFFKPLRGQLPPAPPPPMMPPMPKGYAKKQLCTYSSKKYCTCQDILNQQVECMSHGWAANSPWSCRTLLIPWEINQSGQTNLITPWLGKLFIWYVTCNFTNKQVIGQLHIKSIHPLEDFGSVPQGECEFSNAPTFCVIF